MTQEDKETLQVEPLPGYAPAVGRWLWALADTRRRTLAALEGITPAVLAWRPGPEGNSIGALLYHIALVETDWLYVEILEQAYPAEVEALFPEAMRTEEGQLAPVGERPLVEYLERLRAVRGRLLAELQGMSEEEFRRLRRLEAYDVTPEWVLHHLIQHEAEHRGQILELRALAEREIGD